MSIHMLTHSAHACVRGHRVGRGEGMREEEAREEGDAGNDV